ncbi:putative harbinger transposase-derived nuclease domain-containing protein [Helianthus annuus]|nr:putative harbinger transposase-derived nuclease domain-containing protein [Helianthus annuus]
MINGFMSFTFTDGRQMSLNDQIAMSLTRLSSVNTSINIAIMFDTNDRTVDTVTWEFVQALEPHALEHISWPLDIAETKSRFEKLSGMPNCCGAIETTHVKMHLHESEGETDVWLDRSNNNSMRLQVIVDPAMRFVDVVSGFPGRMTKNGVLHQSEMFRLAQKGEKLNGNRVELSKRTTIPEYLVGDSGFRLLPWLMTPYHDVELNEDQIEYNKRHLATRSVASRALKKLKEVWTVIEGGMWRPNRHKLPRIILACCILHNIQIEYEGDGVSDESMTLFDHDPGYPPEKSTVPEDKNAVVVRDELCLYLARKLPVYMVED